MSPPGRPRKPPPEGVTLRAGALVPEDELAALAGAALDKAGLSLTAAAERVGKSVSTVSDAVNRPARRMTALRLQLLGLAEYGAEGPFYRITKR